MEIAQALAEASKAENWSPARIAAETEVGEVTAKRWIAGITIPSGVHLMILRRKLPGFAEKLDRSAVA